MQLTLHSRINQAQDLLVRDPDPLLALPLISIPIALDGRPPPLGDRDPLVELQVLLLPHGLPNKMHEPSHPRDPAEPPRQEKRRQDLDDGRVGPHEHDVAHAGAVVPDQHVRRLQQRDLLALPHEREVDDVDGVTRVLRVHLLHQPAKIPELARRPALHHRDGRLLAHVGRGPLVDAVVAQDPAREGGQQRLAAARLVGRLEEGGPEGPAPANRADDDVVAGVGG